MQNGGVAPQAQGSEQNSAGPDASGSAAQGALPQSNAGVPSLSPEALELLIRAGGADGGDTPVDLQRLTLILAQLGVGSTGDGAVLMAGALSLIDSLADGSSFYQQGVADALDLLRGNGAFAASQQMAGSFPFYQAGTVTPIAQWPTALVATYNGDISGMLNGVVPIGGTISMTVDFADIHSFAPNIPGTMTFAGGKGGATFTLVQMGGYIGNSMSGTYMGQPISGYIRDGQFYGPAANEVGGLWDFQDAGAALTANGTFVGKR